MNISLPPVLREWVEQQMRQCGFGTASEYFRQLIREEQKRHTRLAVEEKLTEALQSGEPVPVTQATWKATEKRVTERLKVSSTKQRTNGKNR